LAAVLFVRIKSKLNVEELNRRLEERRPRFLEVLGLLQKVYCKDESTGDVCGIYFFKDRASLKEFGESELAKTIAPAYEAYDVRREVYDVLLSLRPERGPFSE